MEEYNQRIITSKMKENDSREEEKNFRRLLLLKMA